MKAILKLSQFFARSLKITLNFDKIMNFLLNLKNNIEYVFSYVLIRRIRFLVKLKYIF